MIHVNNTLTAFEPTGVVGTKVLNKEAFMVFLTTALATLTYPAEGDYKGTAIISLPEAANKTVRAGAGETTTDAKDFHLREYRGAVEKFLKPACAVKHETTSLLLYFIDRYLEDSQVQADAVEFAAAKAAKVAGVEHVLVAIWAGPGAVSDRRMLVNATGGNLAFDSMDKETMVGKFKEHLACKFTAVADVVA